MSRGVTTAALAQLKSALPRPSWSDDPAELAGHLVEMRDRWRGRSPLLLKPATTEEVATAVRICAATKTALVPQGGNTGLVGGQIPMEGEILLSLSRLDKIRSLDPLDNTMTVEAGCILERVCNEAERADRLFPLSLASSGSAQIGGLLSTNAGGHQVLRYGSMRALALGLEVVTARGEVWDGLTRLRKDNTGYDLKDVFIGAEGTLGIVTAAVLRLFPRPRDAVTALAGVADPKAALDLMERLRLATGDNLTAFELMSKLGLELVLRHASGARAPLAVLPPWAVLVECTTTDAPGRLQPLVETALATAIDEGIAVDATVAASRAQAMALWALRESLPEAQQREGGSLKHDIAVPVSKVPEFLSLATTAVTRAIPGIRPVPFGHLGDGNIHFNLSQPVGMKADAYFARRDEMATLVHDIAVSLGGTISAEHGLGQAKREEIRRYKSPVELELMRALKRALDPEGIFNPGKVL